MKVGTKNNKPYF